MEDSKLVQKLTEKLGNSPTFIFLACPPIVFLLPLILLAWWMSLQESVSPVYAAELEPLATGEERPLLMALVCRKQGRLKLGDLHKLRKQLYAQAEAAAEARALASLKAACQ